MTASASTMIRQIALAAIVIFMVSSSVVNAAKKEVITRENWPELTLGKKVIVYFFFPWCQHCKNFKPTWNLMKKKYTGDITFLEINCDDKISDRICQDLGVSGVPEIHYGDTVHMQEYKGKHDEEDLENLIQTVLKDFSTCSIINLQACPEEDREAVAAIEKLSTEYFKKLSSFKVKDPIKWAQQTLRLHDIPNPFWVDVSGVADVKGAQTDEDLFTSDRQSIKELVAEMQATYGTNAENAEL